MIAPLIETLTVSEPRQEGLVDWIAPVTLTAVDSAPVAVGDELVTAPEMLIGSSIEPATEGLLETTAPLRSVWLVTVMLPVALGDELATAPLMLLGVWIAPDTDGELLETAPETLIIT